MPASDDFAVQNEHGTNRRIWARSPHAFGCLSQGFAHEPDIVIAVFHAVDIRCAAPSGNEEGCGEDGVFCAMLAQMRLRLISWE